MSGDDKKDTVGSRITPVTSPLSLDEEKQPPLAFGDFEHEVGIDLYVEGKGVEWTAEEEKTILRKLDLRILPVFCITQGLAFLDKTALNYGNLFGMKAGLHVTGAQFSWFASGFYISYLFAAYPVGRLMQKYPTGKVLGCLAFFWGIVCMTTAACDSFAGGMVNRVILGALEAGVTPGLGLMTPFWWTKQETPVRHLSWVLGAITTLWGIFQFFYLPDGPASARFLTKAEKVIAVKRVAGNNTGTKNTQFKPEQVKEALMDPKLYILSIASVAAQIPNGVVSTFWSIGSLVWSGYLAGRWKNSRAIMMFIGTATCIVAAAALTYAPKDQTWGRLVAFWFTSFQSVGFALNLVMVSANVGGYTKRNTITTVTFIGYCAGNIAGPHVLIASEKPNYPTATKAMMAGYVVKTAAHLILAMYMVLSNRKRDRRAVERGEVLSEKERNAKAEEIGMADTTDFNNPYFRYSL